MRTASVPLPPPFSTYVLLMWSYILACTYTMLMLALFRTKTLYAVRHVLIVARLVHRHARSSSKPVMT